MDLQMRQLFRDQNIDMAKIALWRAGQAVAPDAANEQSAIWLYDSIRDAKWQKYLATLVEFASNYALPGVHPPRAVGRDGRVAIITTGYVKSGVDLNSAYRRGLVKNRKYYKYFWIATTSEGFVERFLKFDASVGQYTVDWFNPKIQAVIFECFMDQFN